MPTDYSLLVDRDMHLLNIISDELDHSAKMEVDLVSAEMLGILGASGQSVQGRME